MESRTDGKDASSQMKREALSSDFGVMDVGKDGESVVAAIKT